MCKDESESSSVGDPSWSISFGFGLSIEFISASASFTPPDPHPKMCECTAGDCGHKVLWRAKRTKELKLEFKKLSCMESTVFPEGLTYYSGSVDQFCGIVYEEEEYFCETTNVVYCPQCPWKDHPCRSSCADRDEKTGAILPDPEPCCLDVEDKVGNPITYPYFVKPAERTDVNTLQACQNQPGEVSSFSGFGNCPDCDSLGY